MMLVSRHSEIRHSSGLSINTRNSNRIMNRIELPTQSISSSTSFTSSDHSFDLAPLDARRLVHDAARSAHDVRPDALRAGVRVSAGGVAAQLARQRAGIAASDAAGEHAELRGRRAPRHVGRSRAAQRLSLAANARTTSKRPKRESTDCISLAQQRFNIHPDRIFLVGHGSGGTMALRVAWNDPAKYAGVASIAGPMPTDLRPLRHVKQIRQLPCLLAMSRHSRDYPDDARLRRSAAAARGRLHRGAAPVSRRR